MNLRDAPTVQPCVSQRYRLLVEKGEIHRDPQQEKVAAALDRLILEVAQSRLATKSSSLGWLFGGRSSSPPAKGLYIHGGVGTGKTMLMDMFFDCLPVKAKRRSHFNDFMTDIHDRIDAHRRAVKRGEAKGDDPIPPVAKAVAKQTKVLCFDEFSVTDIADAMILSRLFTALFADGVVLVATSNVAPDDLYRDGLNRQLFLPFVAILKDHTEIMRLDGGIDYRQEKLARLPVYVTPLDEEADRVMDEAWAAATEGVREEPVEIEIKGRVIVAPRTAHRAARFTFPELCQKPHGARDYLAIVERFDTIFLDHVPVMADAHRNEVKRFIVLVDVLYDRRVRLFASAAAAPEALYAGRRGTEAFEFARTASRLTEMQSRDWLDAWASAHGGKAQI
ncbi:MAG TPA: cell division protein ZapE [Rhizobiaceae bacterium]|nr:cell division protein ZapE [Rhizobiaceae bacterium]